MRAVEEPRPLTKIPTEAPTIWTEAVHSTRGPPAPYNSVLEQLSAAAQEALEAAQIKPP